MAAKKTDAVAVTVDRAQRLFRLLKLLGQGPQTRLALTRKLRVAIRGFYRDLEVLRDVGIKIKLHDSRYHLEDELALLWVERGKEHGQDKLCTSPPARDCTVQNMEHKINAK